MRFLADMGIAGSVVAWPRESGHDATHLRDEGLQRLPDEGVIAKAQAENRILLTFDLDFGEIVALSGGGPVGVVLFRMRNARPARMVERLQETLAEAGPVLERGAFVVVEEARLRIRRLPLGS